MELPDCQATLFFWSPSSKRKSDRRPSPRKETPKQSRPLSPVKAQRSTSKTVQRSSPKKRTSRRGSKKVKGKTKSDVHRFFNEVPDSEDKSQRSVKICMFCEHRMVGVAQRMANHIRDCKSAHEITKMAARLHLNVDDSLPAATLEMPILSASESNDVNRYFLFALISGNVPWPFASNEWLSKAISVLRPGHELPAARTFSSTILKTVSGEVKQEQTKQLAEARYLTLMCDGLTDICRRSLANWIVVDEQRRQQLIQLTSIKTSGGAEGIHEDVRRRAQELKTPSNNIHFTSDSAGAYFKAHRLLAADPDTPILLMGACMAHQSNLIMKDAVVTFNGLGELINAAGTIARAINTSPKFSAQVLAAINEENKREGLASIETFGIWKPTVTRWYSSAVCVKQVINVYSHLVTAMANMDVIAGQVIHVQKIVHSPSFLDRLRQADMLLQPFNFAIALSETDKSTSGQTLLIWLWMLSLVRSSRILTDQEKSRFSDRFCERVRKYGEEHHFVCLVLDPRIRGVGLSEVGMFHAFHFAKRLIKRLGRPADGALIVAWKDYVGQKNLFAPDYWIGVEQPMVFWQLWETMDATKDIAVLAYAVLSYVPHVCASERMWSLLKHTQTQARARLTEANLDSIMNIKIHANRAKSSTVAEKYAVLLEKVNKVKMNVMFGVDSQLFRETQEACPGECIDIISPPPSSDDQPGSLDHLLNSEDDGDRDFVILNAGDEDENDDVEGLAESSMNNFCLDWLAIDDENQVKIEEVIRLLLKSK